MRLPRLFGRDPSAEPANALYREVVRQSRLPVFYTQGGVPDSLDGRFELIVLHAYLIMRRLKRDGDAGRALSQALFDMLFADMDRSLREMGVGDLGVGRRVKAMARGFFGRVAAYDEGLAGDDEILAEALRRNVYGTISIPLDALKLMVRYTRRQDLQCQTCPGDSLLAGNIAFVPPSFTAPN